MVIKDNDSTAIIRTDSRWFNKVLINLLANTTPGQLCNTECEVEVKDKKLIITTCSCANYRKKTDEQNMRILHNINTLFIKQCGGELTTYQKDEHCKIEISLPLIR